MNLGSTSREAGVIGRSRPDSSDSRGAARGPVGLLARESLAGPERVERPAYRADCGRDPELFADCQAAHRDKAAGAASRAGCGLGNDVSARPNHP